MKTGFTLIELLVVVLIIGILAAVALPQYQVAVEKARAAEVFVNGRHLAEAEELFYLANGRYTDDWNELGETQPTSKSYDYRLDHSSYNIRIEHKTIPGLYFRFFMQNLTNFPGYAGRYLCQTLPSSEQGMRICGSLGKNPIPYTGQEGGYLAFFLN